MTGCTDAGRWRYKGDCFGFVEYPSKALRILGSGDAKYPGASGVATR